MNVTFKKGEQVNGYKIIARNGLSQFVAENENVRIVFNTDSGEGRNYSKIIGYSDLKTNRYYQSMRYLIKYVSTVQGFSNVLYQKYLKENGGN